MDCEDNKCTFGFNAQIDEDTCPMEANGQFQFNEHAGTKIHAEVTGDLYLFGWGYVFEGETKDGEKVYFKVEDEGEPGADAGDWIWIKIDSDKWFGKLGGGNIQVHESD